MNINSSNLVLRNAQLYNAVNNSGTVIDVEPHETFKEQSLLESILKWNPEEGTPFVKDPCWDLSQMPLQYYIEENPVFPEAIGVIHEGFSTWEVASQGKLSFVSTLNGSDAEIAIVWSDTTLPDRPYEAGHNTLKVFRNRIQFSEITLIKEPLFDRQGKLPQKERLRRTMLHEIGHAIGLKHSVAPHDIMYHRAIMNGDITRGDINQINRLYPSIQQFVLA